MGACVRMNYCAQHGEEHLIVEVLGVAERGNRTDGPFQRKGDRAGTGWVAATTDHQYADAQRRSNGVTLLVAETTGGMDGVGALSAPRSRPFCASSAARRDCARRTTPPATASHPRRRAPSTRTTLPPSCGPLCRLMLVRRCNQHAAAAMSFKLTVGIMP